MPDDLHERLTDYLTNLEVTVRPVNGHAHIVAESMADALLPFIRAEIDRPPPRVQAAEDRLRFRDMLSKSSLGEADVVAAVEQFRREREALPDRWVSLRRVDFIGLIELYRERREVHNEDHDDALDYLLAEVDFEPNQDDLFDRRNRLD